MIKVDKHQLTCRCADCQTTFPHGRYDAVWVAAPADGPVRRAIGPVPIGASGAPYEVVVWVTADNRLASDWPGFPGTAGALVTLDRPVPGESPRVIGTVDPALAALAEPIPLRRRLVDRFNARCLVDYGLAPEDTADYIPCVEHGHGLPATTCRHVIGSAEAIDVAVVYDVDGDYPDAFCEACLERYTQRDLSVCVTVCSRCQQRNLYRHHIVQTTWYGAASG